MSSSSTNNNSSKNPHLYRDGDIDLDARMSQETKDFVREWLRTSKPSDLFTLPLETLRNARDHEEKQLIASLKFDNLGSPDELLVKNSTDGYDIPVSVFRPTDAPSNASIVVFFHGGGFVYGSRQMYYHACATLASLTRTVWVSVEYRLAPEHKHRTQFTDYRAVIEWAHANRGQLAAVDSKLGVAGESAGGQIAAVMAHVYKSILDFQILVYPAVDMVSKYESFDQFESDCYLIKPSMIEFFVNAYLDEPESEARLPQVTPLFYDDFSGLPKCIILGAELDMLLESNRAYHEKIVRHGGHSELRVIMGTVHEYFSSGTGLKNAFDECARYISDFLAKV